MAKESTYFEGIGRRKLTIARVRIYKDTDTSFVINGKGIEVYYPLELDQKQLLRPFTVANLQGKFRVSAQVSGGGKTGWADAIILGIARALIAYDEKLKSQLRKEGLVTRDPRAVERKKTGLKKARKAPRFSKR